MQAIPSDCLCVNSNNYRSSAAPGLVSGVIDSSGSNPTYDQTSFISTIDLILYRLSSYSVFVVEPIAARSKTSGSNPTYDQTSFISTIDLILYRLSSYSVFVVEPIAARSKTSGSNPTYDQTSFISTIDLILYRLSSYSVFVVEPIAARSKTERPPIEKTKQKHPSQKYRKPSQTSIPFLHKVHINGDSHTRHIAELCMPGARLLDVLKPTPTFPEPGPRCEVLIAGTNDLAIGTQRNIYRHLEPYITSRASNTELLVATLPHRHDLHPAHPIHDETVLVNAYIEELAVRHNFRVLKFHELSRRYFTRHGQHLSMRGKRVLAEIIVKSLTATQRPVKTVPPPFEPTPAATRHPAIRRLSVELLLRRLRETPAMHLNWMKLTCKIF
ncbi:hypothetical protein J6590_065662 [Homalodisca vitripennis]|nr:hypothetical protein J6590_065662 [Homalodisca vitripennis]